MAYTVCCFGHKEILYEVENAEQILKSKSNLTAVLINLILDYGATTFLTGRRGEFDNMFANAVRELKGKYPFLSLVLVEPYFSNSLNLYKDYYSSLYDSIIIPDELADVHYKQAITLRNRWMVDNSDCLVAYCCKKRGGAYNALKYGTELGKEIINLADTCPISK